MNLVREDIVVYGVELSPLFDVLSKDSLVEMLDTFVFNYATGEPHVRITPPDTDIKYDDVVVITSQFKSFQDLGIIAMAVDALRRMGFRKLNLMLPYLPSASLDEVKVVGEPLSLKVVAYFLNNLSLDHVITWDLQSKVAKALINNLVVVDNKSFIDRVCLDIQSTDRNELFMAYPNVKLSLTQDKLRNSSVLIVASTVTQSETFVSLAKFLKKEGVKKVYLAATHGVFTNGFEELNKWVDMIYTTTSYDGQRQSKMKEITYL